MDTESTEVEDIVAVQSFLDRCEQTPDQVSMDETGYAAAKMYRAARLTGLSHDDGLTAAATVVSAFVESSVAGSILSAKAQDTERVARAKAAEVNANATKFGITQDYMNLADQWSSMGDPTLANQIYETKMF